MEPPRDDDSWPPTLRALRPTPRPEFAAELDERAAAGFPRRSRLPRLSPRRPARVRTPRRVLIPAGGVAVLAIAIVTAVIGLERRRAEASQRGRLSPACMPAEPARRRQSAKPSPQSEGSAAGAPSASDMGSAAAEAETGSMLEPEAAPEPGAQRSAADPKRQARHPPPRRRTLRRARPRRRARRRRRRRRQGLRSGPRPRRHRPALLHPRGRAPATPAPASSC